MKAPKNDKLVEAIYFLTEEVRKLRLENRKKSAEVLREAERESERAEKIVASAYPVARQIAYIKERLYTISKTDDLFFAHHEVEVLRKGIEDIENGVTGGLLRGEKKEAH